MTLRRVVTPLVEAASERAAREVDHWRGELERPWREGRDETPARVGRWIGLGLAVGAAVAGVVAALVAERPWESR